MNPKMHDVITAHAHTQGFIDLIRPNKTSYILTQSLNLQPIHASVKLHCEKSVSIITKWVITRHRHLPVCTVRSLCSSLVSLTPQTLFSIVPSVAWVLETHENRGVWGGAAVSHVLRGAADFSLSNLCLTTIRPQAVVQGWRQGAVHSAEPGYRGGGERRMQIFHPEATFDMTRGPAGYSSTGRSGQ